MALFRPNLDCVVRRKASTNVYGEETLSDPVTVRCAVIQLKIITEKSSVRADSSASRGAAREYIGEAKLLFLPDDAPGTDDRIDVSGFKLHVIGSFPRHSLDGVLDHVEVFCGIWGKT
jgi:hypothetical protein